MNVRTVDQMKYESQSGKWESGACLNRWEGSWCNEIKDARRKRLRGWRKWSGFSAARKVDGVVTADADAQSQLY